MLLKQIEYFLKVVDTGIFSEAAEQCFISQSAVSQQIKTLENELGLQLLKRHNRTFSLTPAGELFYRKCTVLLNVLDGIIRETKAIGRNEKPVFRIEYLKCYGRYEFQNTVSEFSEKNPEIKLEVINTGYSNVLSHIIKSKE